MPYYVYRVISAGPLRQLVRIGAFAAFRDASREAKRLRRETDRPDGEAIRTVFAGNELEAEDLLGQPRGEAPPSGEEY